MSRRPTRGLAVVVTGASSGIGRAFAVELHRRGGRLVLAARREDRLRALNDELGGGHEVVVADVSEPDGCRRIVDAAYERFGRVDVLCPNAGYGLSRPTWEQTPAEVRRMFATNVHGTHDLIHHAVPRMLEQTPVGGWRGQILIVSSAAARRGLPFFGPYSATKAAQLSLAESLRAELREHRIGVTSVHPVGTTTEFFDVSQRDPGSTKVLGIGNRGGQQTAGHVARRMADAVERPGTREVWPARGYRYLLAANALAPGVGDRVMRAMKRQIDAGQPR